MLKFWLASVSQSLHLPFKFIIGKGACKVPCANCQIPIRKSHPDMAFPTRSPLKQVRSPSGAPPEPLEIEGGAPQVPFCFRLESAATHEGILCGKLPPCYVVAINYQPTGQSSGYSRATRQACIFLTPAAPLAPADGKPGQRYCAPELATHPSRVRSLAVSNVSPSRLPVMHSWAQPCDADPA